MRDWQPMEWPEGRAACHGLVGTRGVSHGALERGRDDGIQSRVGALDVRDVRRQDLAC